MAVKKYFADADTTITNAFKTNLTTRGIDAIMGASDILETFSIYGQASSDSTELERLLIKFPIDEITAARAKDEAVAEIWGAMLAIKTQKGTLLLFPDGVFMVLIC